MTDTDRTRISEGTALADSTVTASGGTMQSPEFTAVAGEDLTLDSRSLKDGDTALIGITEYTVESLLGAGSEAEVYVVSSDGTRYALKLYRKGRAPLEPVIEKLDEIRNRAATTHIVLYGTLKVSGTQRPYVLMDLCQGGSAASHDFRGNAEAILKTVVMTARNLNELHKAGVLHKDTKPENILFTDDSLDFCVLSDFGISEILTPDGSVNGLQERSVIYAAPEIYTKASIIDGRTYAIMTPAYDYYALGMTALAMWMGTGEFRKKESELVRLKMQGKVPVPDSMPEPLRSMVRGLLAGDEKRRWGFDEIQRCLKGENVPTADGPASLHIVFDSAKGKIAGTPAELARFMMQDQQLGIRYLYKGRLSEWLRDSMPELEVALEGIVEDMYPQNQVAGLYEAAMTMDPDLPYYDLSGHEYRSLTDLCLAGTTLSGSLADPDNPLYIYCRHRFGKQKADLCRNRVAKALKDPVAQYPAEVFAWCLYETSSLCHTFSGKNRQDDRFTSMNCHNPSEVLKFCATHRIVRDEDKRFLSSPAFVEMVRVFSESDASRLESLRTGVRDFQVLYRLVIQTLNPSADINLISDPKDPWYAMTGQGLGKLVNLAFNAYYGHFHADRDRLYDNWADKSNPWRDVCQASLVDLIVKSFAPGAYPSSYIRRFFATKGSRFDAQDRWMKYCTDYNGTDNSRKYGPYDRQIAMMKAVSGFGYVPEYRFSDGTVTRNVSELDSYRKRSGAETVRQAMRSGFLYAWIAVQYQENPKANLKPKYSYEKLTRDYVEKLGQCNPDEVAFRRYRTARSSVEKSGSFQPVLLLGLLQYVFIAAGMLLFLVSLGFLAVGIFNEPWIQDTWLRKQVYLMLGPVIFCLLLNQFFSEDRIFGFFESIVCFFISMGVLYIASRLLLWRLVPYITLLGTLGFAAYFFFRLVPRNEGSAELLSMRKADFEQLVLEPLHFAFRSDDASFRSSLEANGDYYRDCYKESLAGKTGPLILALITSFILMSNSTVAWGMLSAERNSDAGQEVTAETAESARTNDAVQETGQEATQSAEPAARQTAKTAATKTAEPAATKTTEPKATQAAKPAADTEFGITISAADGITAASDGTPQIGSDGVFRFSLSNSSGADMTPFIVIEEPSANIVSRAEAIDDQGNAYSAAKGKMTVTIGDATMNASNRDPVFNFSDGQKVRGTVTIRDLDRSARRVDIRIPLREFDPDAYPYRRGYIIFKNIPVQQ